MVIVSGLFAALEHLMGSVATMTMGWATVLLFGRVPQAQQRLLAALTLGSLVWLLAVLTMVSPAVGGTVLAVIPRLGFMIDAYIQAAMVILVIGLPLGIGHATLALAPGPRGPLLVVQHLLRGYPLAAVLGGTTLFLVVLSVALKVRGLQRGWEADHLPMIIKSGRYDAVVADLMAALRGAGLEVLQTHAPWVMTVPPKLIVAVGGGVGKHLVPDDLAEFQADGLWILIYPSDVALVGRKELLARARSAIARRLTFADAYLTSAKESEQIEDRLAELSQRPELSATDFRPVDEQLASLSVPYGDWQTLYRLRLQVELKHLQAANT